MPNRNILIDTNVLLDDPKILHKSIKTYEKVVIPLTVLKELDKHKFNPDLSYSARTAIYEIVAFKEEYPDRLILATNDDETSTNDLLILEAAKEHDADVATKDLSMSVIAEAKGIDTVLYDIITNGLFKPYKYVDVEALNGFDYQQHYRYEDFISKSGVEVAADCWQFVFMFALNENDIAYVYATNPLKGSVVRIDNEPKYREVSVEGNRIKALDFYQICALYAMIEAESVLITGKWGTGKTLLSSAYALANNNSKVFITRPPVGINHKFDIGYLPGDKDEKMMSWFAGFMSALYFIYANTRNQVSNKDKEVMRYDMVKDKYFKQCFETMPINAIQGMSLLEGDTMIVDELQLIDIDYLSMILSRASENSKLILLGDLAQTYNVVRPSESGLLKLLRILPHRSLAYVDLQNSYRNELVELADKLQDKTF